MMNLTRLVLSLVIVNVSLPTSFADVFSWDEINGFIETRGGIRVNDDPYQKQASIGELRLQVAHESSFDEATLNIVSDFVLDPVLGQYNIDLESGKGFVDLRQFNIMFSPIEIMDVKIGRQILTWGTGDLVFANDLFAKDFIAFFIGRDNEYLKAPTDAAKISIFTDIINADIVYTPKFSADRYIDGQRLSFFDSASNTFRGNNNPLSVNQPDEIFNDDELAIRLYRNLGNAETALYYYHGFWKSPAAINTQTKQAIFPKLNVYGASLRSSLAQGISNIELAYYQGDNTPLSNTSNKSSEFRLILGYETEIANALTMGLQYNLEHTRKSSDTLTSLPARIINDDDNRHILSIRFTKLLWQQNLTLSLFNFYSPSDKDGYLRLSAMYKFTDTFRVEGGSHLFYGDDSSTFFAQFKHNNNVYAAMRISF